MTVSQSQLTAFQRGAELPIAKIQTILKILPHTSKPKRRTRLSI